MTPEKTDVVLIGAGIMSSTLGTLLRVLQPEWDIHLYERLDSAAEESSKAWNNAGTGHSALCELNYTPQTASGDVDISKAIGVNEKFQVSRQFWSNAVDKGILGDPAEWIHPVPHVSFVDGQEGADYLRKRYDSMSKNVLFDQMEFSTDFADLERVAPLMAKGRNPAEPFGLSYVNAGTDVDFGSLTEQQIGYLARSGTTVRYGAEVTSLERTSDGKWRVSVEHKGSGQRTITEARFVFVGAGGGALHLLQKSGIPEIRGMAGFPVGGEWLRCTDQEIIAQHDAKVYGMAAVGAPPMSVPHLDTRVIDGQKGLLFGPFAGWTPKFLKEGSWLDLPTSVRPHNLLSMAGVGVQELGLVKFLISELLKGHEKKVDDLRKFVPSARSDSWEREVAGQRVQVVRPHKRRGGSLEFGTALVNSADGSIAGLLGASPGASTCVAAMIDVLQRCFPANYPHWEPKLREMVPSLGRDLENDKSLYRQVWDHSQEALKLSKSGS